MWESVGVAPTERRLTLTRTGSAVRVQEVGEGPPIVFIHGASNSGVSWAPLVGRLDGFHRIVVDRPGCGLSPPLATRFDDAASLAAFAEAFVADILDALDLARAHVVATSFGGYHALRSAAAHPDRIDRMVLLGWSVGAPLERTPIVMRVASVPLIGRLMVAIPPTERTVRMIFKSIGLRQALEAGRISQEMLGSFLALLRDTDTMRNELAAGPRLLTPIRGLNADTLLPIELLNRVTTPVHFLWGDEDPMGGAAVARAFVAHLPNADLELVPGGGHAVWIDDPELAASTVTRFCASSAV
jgi:2-hydroxy-6-oxonona-2,4-dienedioate hydrolase/4,5:9,10-diseco-3-hydroxy-5,9,17-trioxoandrosta-1(10),2-diene-4-oate hydrolase